MDTDPDQARLDLLAAVNALITRDDARDLFDILSTVAGVASRAPIRLDGDAAILNPLLSLRVRQPESYTRALELIESRRALMGYPPLVVPVNKDGYDKTAYMRQFMDQKRERQRKAAEVENMRRPERDRLIGNARLEFMRVQSQRWKELRDLAIERARLAAGGTLSADLRKDVINRFWEAVDADLDSKYDQAKKASLDPSRKVPHQDDDMSSLLEALRLPSR